MPPTFDTPLFLPKLGLCQRFEPRSAVSSPKPGLCQSAKRRPPSPALPRAGEGGRRRRIRSRRGVPGTPGGSRSPFPRLARASEAPFRARGAPGGEAGPARGPRGADKVRVLAKNQPEGLFSADKVRVLARGAAEEQAGAKKEAAARARTKREGAGAGLPGSWAGAGQVVKEHSAGVGTGLPGAGRTQAPDAHGEDRCARVFGQHRQAERGGSRLRREHDQQANLHSGFADAACPGGAGEHGRQADLYPGLPLLNAREYRTRVHPTRNHCG